MTLVHISKFNFVFIVYYVIAFWGHRMLKRLAFFNLKRCLTSNLVKIKCTEVQFYFILFYFILFSFALDLLLINNYGIVSNISLNELTACHYIKQLIQEISRQILGLKM